MRGSGCSPQAIPRSSQPSAHSLPCGLSDTAHHCPSFSRRATAESVLSSPHKSRFSVQHPHSHSGRAWSPGCQDTVKRPLSPPRDKEPPTSCASPSPWSTSLTRPSRRASLYLGTCHQQLQTIISSEISPTLRPEALPASAAVPGLVPPHQKVKCSRQSYEPPAQVGGEAEARLILTSFLSHELWVLGS